MRQTQTYKAEVQEKEAGQGGDKDILSVLCYPLFFLL